METSIYTQLEISGKTEEIMKAISVIMNHQYKTGRVSRGELTADVSADYLRNERISDCAFVSENARCQQSAGTLSEEGLDQQTDHNKNQAARYFAA